MDCNKCPYSIKDEEYDLFTCDYKNALKDKELECKTPSKLLDIKAEILENL